MSELDVNELMAAAGVFAVTFMNAEEEETYWSLGFAFQENCLVDGNGHCLAVYNNGLWMTSDKRIWTSFAVN